ncbi:MAG: glycosyltransferase [Verrucomicrobiia bacterium]
MNLEKTSPGLIPLHGGNEHLKRIQMISFIVPAHNEQACLGRTLQAIQESAHVVGQPYEIVVVDDASTDATAEIARRHHATVVPVNHRQIAAARNSGAHVARGERLFFVDADTTINPRAVAEAMCDLDRGAAGGGATVWFEGTLPLYVQLLSFLFGVGAKFIGSTGGAFVFCTRSAFQAAGGFNERLYWGEETFFIMALKRTGRFAVLKERVLTSGRRFRSVSGLATMAIAARAIVSPFKTFTRRSSVEKVWYDSNREADDIMPITPGVKVSNGVALLVTVLLVTGPLWNFIPWSLTPWASPLGRIRLVIEIFLCHAALALWPITSVLVWNLLRRKQWVEWMKMAALCAYCLWQAWVCTRGVIWFWTRLCHWLAHWG